MKYLLGCLFYCSFPLLLLSQDQYTLSGTVSDQNDSPLPYGDVQLFTLDSLPLQFSYIDNGQFQLDPVPAGNYLLTITCLGFDQYAQKISLEKDQQLVIQIRESTELLDAVTVTAQKSTIVNRNGNLTVDVANSVLATQATPVEILSQLPTIMVNPNGESINVIGKGSPLIYLDNQRINMTQVQALSVDEIQSIEIINNPSAKYEAEGRAVVLIKRKATIADGYKVNLSEVASWRRRFNNYASLNASFKKNAWELKSNVAYQQLTFWESLQTEFETKQPAFSMDRTGTFVGPRPTFIIGSGIYYQLKNGGYLSSNFNWRFHHTDGETDSNATILSEGVQSTDKTRIEDNGERDFFTSNLNYNQPLRAGNLFLGVQFSHYNRGDISAIFDENNSQSQLLQNRDQLFSTNALATRMDYERTLNKNIKWETGINYYKADADAFAFFQFSTPTDAFQSDYDYAEKNYAAYTQFGGMIDQLQYAIGLRYELTEVQGGFEQSNTLLIDRQQPIFFPRLSLSHPIDSTKSIAFNYNKTVRRPNYLNASSISTYSNPFMEFSRNINLLPTITQEASLNFQWGQRSIEWSYSKGSNPVFFSIRNDPDSNRAIMFPDNFEQIQNWSCRLISSFQYKKWSSNNVLIATISRVTDDRASSDTPQPYLYFYSNHRLSLPQQFTAGLNFFHIGKRKDGIFSRNAVSSWGASLSKTFNKQWQATVQLNDIFRGRVFKDSFTVNQFETTNTFFADAKAVEVSMRYSFGGDWKSTFQNREVDEQLNRMN